MLLAELESMQQQMVKLMAELKASFKLTLVEQLDQREVGGSGFARGNEIADKLDTLLEKVSEVSRAAQVSQGVPTLLAFEDTSELEESGRLVEEEEEDVVLELDKPARMPPHKCARIINERTQQQLANQNMKLGFHHGPFSPLPASWRYPKGLTAVP